jgi:SAM-dependent methyltransferase
MKPTAFDLHARAEDHHWWFAGMRATARQLLDDGSAWGAVLDAGCGTGGWLASLADVCAPGVALDLQSYALATARRRGLTQLVQGSVTSLPFRDGCFDLVTSLDVVYHQDVGSDQMALDEFYRVLRPGGRLLLQVPAYDWLRSRHDLEVFTRERYSAPVVRRMLETSGFTVARLTHANGVLLPAAVAWRLTERWLPPGPARDLLIPSPPLNRLGLTALALERRWLARVDLPIGLSLMALARRPAAAEPLPLARSRP